MNTRRFLCLVCALLLLPAVPTMADTQAGPLERTKPLALYREKEVEFPLLNLYDALSDAQITQLINHQLEIRINGILLESPQLVNGSLRLNTFALIALVEAQRLIASGEATADELVIDQFGKLIRIDADGKRTSARESYQFAALGAELENTPFELNITFGAPGAAADDTVELTLKGVYGGIVEPKREEEAPVPGPIQPPEPEEEIEPEETPTASASATPTPTPSTSPTSSTSPGVTP